MMEKLTEKIQEEAWAKISPYFEWYRLLIFVSLNFFLSPGFLEIFLSSMETKTLRDTSDILGEMAGQLKIKDVFFSFLASFWLFPWLSSKLNWLLLNKIHFSLAKPLVKKIEEFADEMSKNQIPDKLVIAKLQREKNALKRFKFLKILSEVFLLLISFVYTELLLDFDVNIFLPIALVILGFFGTSQLMMVIFLRDIVPAQIIRQLRRI